MTKKVLNHEWQRLATRLKLSPENQPGKYKALRAAYYHGATVTFEAVINGLDHTSDDLTEGDRCHLDGIMAELNDFRAEIMAPHDSKDMQARMEAMLKTSRRLEATCPFCGKAHDTVVCPVPGHEGAQPKPGDLTLCVNCGEWCVFDDPVTTLRKPTDAEYEALAADPVVRKAREAWTEYKAAQKPEQKPAQDGGDAD